jgi:hypothetical protein
MTMELLTTQLRTLVTSLAFTLFIPLLHLSLLVLPVASVEDMVIPGPFYLRNILLIADIIQNLLSASVLCVGL